MDDALTLIKAAYPAQYYGQYDTSTQAAAPLTTVMDVWSGRTAQGSQVNILSLPAAGAMVAMTAAQWALFQNAPYVWQQAGALLYPARYYAAVDADNLVTGWYDVGALSTVVGLPSASAMVPVPPDLWDARSGQYQAVNGALVVYTPPVAPIPLKDLAAAELSGWIAPQAAMASAMGETFTDAMKAYVKAVQAIASGADTTSTAMPARPTSSMS